MSITTSEMTPADIRACTCGNDGGNGGNGNNGMFGNDWAWIIILLLFGFGGRGFGGGYGGGSGNGGSIQPIVIDNGNPAGYGCGCGCGSPCATQADLAAGFNNSAVLSNLNDLQLGQASIQQTLCQGFGGVNQSINTVGYQISNGLCNLGYNVQSGFNGISREIGDCCCDIKGGIKDVAYGNAMNTSAIQKQISDCCCDLEKANMQSRFDAQAFNANTLQAIDRVGDRIIDYMANEKLQSLRDENQSLRLAASQSAQNAALMAAMDANTATIIRRTGNDCPVPAYVVQPPQPVSFATNCCGQVGFSGNCGCGNGGF